MKSYKIKQGVLTQVNGKIPSISKNEVLVKIHAVSLNYRDLLVTKGIGQWKPTKNRIPVSDGAGEVVKIGSSIKKFKVGDRVTSLIAPHWESGKLSPEKLEGALGGSSRDGVLAEYVALTENAICRFPDYLSYVEASTLPVASLTAWNAVIEQSTLKVGSTILIIGTGGVSLFSLQFSKLAGYQIILTSSNDEKLEKAKELGAHHMINYQKNPDWTSEVMSITRGRGVDQVVDVVGGDHITESLKCLKSEGMVSMVGVMAGTKGLIDTGMVMNKAAKIQGVETGSTEMYKRMLTAMHLHKVKPTVDSVFSYEQVPEAFLLLKNGGHFGKICVQFH